LAARDTMRKPAEKISKSVYSIKIEPLGLAKKRWSGYGSNKRDLDLPRVVLTTINSNHIACNPGTHT
jgi:hypothetical protein